MDPQSSTMEAGSDSPGEAIVICIDDTTSPEYVKAQCQSIIEFATVKIQSHPQTVIGLLTTSMTELKVAVNPTRELDDISCGLEGLRRCGEELDVQGAVARSICMLNSSRIPKGIQKRIIMFVGGIISIPVELASEYATPLVKFEVALDVVNFTRGDPQNHRRVKLKAFVAAVNKKDNTEHIIDVEDGTSLSNLLYSFYRAPGPGPNGGDGGGSQRRWWWWWVAAAAAAAAAVVRKVRAGPNI